MDKASKQIPRTEKQTRQIRADSVSRSSLLSGVLDFAFAYREILVGVFLKINSYRNTRVAGSRKLLHPRFDTSVLRSKDVGIDPQRNSRSECRSLFPPTTSF